MSTATKEKVERKKIALALKHEGFCDGCLQLKELNTMAGHKRCPWLDKVMLPRPDLVGIPSDKYPSGRPLLMERPQECVDVNEVNIIRQNDKAG